MGHLPIIKQLADLFGMVLRGLYLITDFVGFPNITICIITIVILSKFFMMRSTYSGQKRSILAPKLLPAVQEITKKYDNKLDHPLCKEKLNTDKGFLLTRYNIGDNGGCLKTLLQFPVLIALYAIMYDIPNHIPELKTLTEAELNNVYNFLGINILEVPGFKISILLIFPILVAVTQLLLMYQSAEMSKVANNGKLQGGIMNAVIIGMMFYFGATFPVLMNIYWIAKSIVDIVINFILVKFIKEKPLSFFEEIELKKKNKNRAKRGLPPLSLSSTTTI